MTLPTAFRSLRVRLVALACVGATLIVVTTSGLLAFNLDHALDRASTTGFGPGSTDIEGALAQGSLQLSQEEAFAQIVDAERTRAVVVGEHRRRSTAAHAGRAPKREPSHLAHRPGDPGPRIERPPRRQARGLPGRAHRGDRRRVARDRAARAPAGHRVARLRRAAARDRARRRRVDRDRRRVAPRRTHGRGSRGDLDVGAGTPASRTDRRPRARAPRTHAQRDARTHRGRRSRASAPSSTTRATSCAPRSPSCAASSS